VLELKAIDSSIFIVNDRPRLPILKSLGMGFFADSKRLNNWPLKRSIPDRKSLVLKRGNPEFFFQLPNLATSLGRRTWLTFLPLPNLAHLPWPASRAHLSSLPNLAHLP
jgi:hypothetical protein